MLDFLSIDTTWALPLVAWLSTYALHSTLLLSLAWLAARWLQGSLAHDALWKATLFAGVFTASSPASEPDTAVVVLFADAGPREFVELHAHGQTSILLQESARPSVFLQKDPARGAAKDERVTFSMTDLALPVEAQRWAWLLAGFWLLGVLIEGLRRVRSHRRFMLRIADRSPVSAPRLQAELARTAQHAGLRYPIRLTQADALGAPVALGVDEIVMPTWALQESTPARQRAMIAHEVAHLARRDPFWLAVFALAESLFFFQPLNVLARRRQQAAAERLCDAWAAEVTTPLTMAQSLVDVASRLRAQRLVQALPSHSHIVSGMASGSDTGLNARVEHLISGNAGASRRRWPVLVATLCITGLMACAAPAFTSTAAATQTSASPPSPPAPPTALAPPAPRTAPAPPVPPAPPALVVDTSKTFSYTVNDDRRSLRIERKGSVALLDDGTVSITNGGRILIDEDLDGLSRRYEARMVDGAFEERYRIDGDARPIDEDARRWIRDRLREMEDLKPPPPPPPPRLGDTSEWMEFERQMEAFATQMEQYEQEFSSTYASEFAEFEARMTAYARDMEGWSSRLEGLTEEQRARIQERVQRLELDRPNAEELRRQAERLEREAQRIRHEADRMRHEYERLQREGEQSGDDG